MGKEFKKRDKIREKRRADDQRRLDGLIKLRNKREVKLNKRLEKTQKKFDRMRKGWEQDKVGERLREYQDERAQGVLDDQQQEEVKELEEALNASDSCASSDEVTISDEDYHEFGEEKLRVTYREKRAMIVKAKKDKRGVTLLKRHCIKRLRHNYLEEITRASREAVEREFRILNAVMASWSGQGIKTCFEAWAGWTKETIVNRAKSKVDKARNDALEEQAKQAQNVLLSHEVAKWKKKTEQFTNVVYYQHCETDERRETRPTIDEVEFVPRKVHK
jgi:hypothetical protein